MTDLNSAKQRPGEEDLSWLARNVHGWGANIALMGRILRNGEYSPVSAAGAAPKGAMWFTRDQWLTRRAELQNKPSWDDVPSDIEYMAQETNGAWGCWYDKPKPDEDINNNGDAVWCWAGNRPAKDFNIANEQVGEVLGDWRDTLERRPQTAKSEPVPEPSGDDWHKLGELPPLGVLVRLIFKGDYAYDCEIVAVRGEYVVLWCADACMSEAIKLEDCRFEPIQTERERIAAELVDVMLAVPVSDRKTASESFMSMALAIYDHLHKESRV
ncbi:MAG: hypothetical protein ACRCXB_18545 [Aeromonadaceae bacterium]